MSSNQTLILSTLFQFKIEKSNQSLPDKVYHSLEIFHGLLINAFILLSYLIKYHHSLASY